MQVFLENTDDIVCNPSPLSPDNALRDLQRTLASASRRPTPPSDAALARHLLDVAAEAFAIGDRTLAEHFVEIAFDVCDRPRPAAAS